MAPAGSAAVFAAGCAFLLRPVSGNWLLQCSSCVDQAYFGDMSLKENIIDADLEVLLAQLKQVRLREFDHREDEFFNKFFSKRQLGIITQELQSVIPQAVATVPERRWTNAKGTSMATKNVQVMRDSHLIMTLLGSVQLLAKKADFWDVSIERLTKDMDIVLVEQQDNRRKREEMLEQIVRIIAKVEVMQHVLAKTEAGFVRLDTDVHKVKETLEEQGLAMTNGIGDLTNRSLLQDARIQSFQDEFREAVDREARADLVEARKKAEADMEVQLVKRSIEKMRWEEEQKTILMREEEKRGSEEHSSRLHQERVAHELGEQKRKDLEVMHQQEESNRRQEEARVAGERELLMLRLESEEKNAQLDVQKAIEAAKIESEAKIREKRENEELNLRHMRAEQQEKRQQTLATLHAGADIALGWIRSLYSSPQNLGLLIGSIVACLGGVFLMREMAVLLREQLNKRLGRPSLVRSTNRRGTIQQIYIWIMRLLRLRGAHGSEFSDVVLHPFLHKQVMRLADATNSAKNRRMPLMHVMFYGPPGTGKTMVAQRFAEYSGLEYAIMSGGDVAPLQEDAVTELHKLFKWVHRSRKGVLLFIDEADAFLTSRKGTNMSEPLRNALTTMLYHTGTPSSQFMMVLATNRPGDLDAAVLDRIDESVEFGLPDIDARKGMISIYFDKFITRPLSIKLAESESGDTMVKKAAVVSGLRQRLMAGRAALPGSPKAGAGEVPRAEQADAESMAEVARKLHGFSGREISKLFTSLQTHILYSDADIGRGVKTLSKKMLFEVVDQKAIEHTRTADFQVSGYDYVHNELLSPHDSEHSMRRASPTGAAAIGLPGKSPGKRPPPPLESPVAG